MTFDLSLSQLGSGSAYLALALAVYAAIAGAVGAVRRDARLQTSARLAAVAGFFAVTTAVVTMQAALLSDDFTVRYVAETSRSTSPLWVKIATMWAALEGSILLWAWLLSGYTALLAAVAPNTKLRPWALVVMQIVLVFFLGVLAVLANPFVAVASPPLEGPGPNPLLQNHWMMAVHPVLLYLGYVGLTVPFAYAMAALITRRPGSEWMTQTRRWTLTGWGFLTAGIVAGGWWSYEVLGWGGFWAWDPVENVSFLPWLTATAFIHSVQVQERRRMLKGWNVMLVTLTFSLTLLGTFLIRSGVVSSVHSFGNGPVGPAFLGFFLLATAVSFGLVALRWDQVRDRAELDSPVSREGSFLAGNVLFLAMAFAVLLGTLFPLIVEAVNGAKVTVGAPFFDQVSVPLWLTIFALMGIGPLLPWRRAEGSSLLRSLAWLVGAGVASAGVAAALGMREVSPLITVGLAGYNVASFTLLIVGAVVPRARLSERGALGVLVRYASENRRRFGSMIVHLGVVVTALGVMAASAYRVDEQVRIDFGASATFQGYTLTAADRFMERSPQRISAGAVVEVREDGRLLRTLRPRTNLFPGQQQQVPTPAVLYRPTHDLYLSVASTVGPDSEFVVLRVVRSPLVVWIWVGGLIMVLGTAYALTPGRRAAARLRAATSADASAADGARS